MYQQVQFQAEQSATVSGQWIGVVRDAHDGHALTQTGLTYDTPDEARFGARVKWIGRAAKLHNAMGAVA